MKIAQLSTIYPFRGGIAQFNASLYRALEKKHEVKAYTFIRQYPDFLFPGKNQYVQPNDIPDIIPSTVCLDTINPLSYLSTAKKIKEFAPDILLMKYWMSFFGPSLGTVAKKLKSKTKIISIIDNAISHEKRFFDTAFTKYFLKQNHGFIAMSQAVADDIRTLQPGAKILMKEHPIYNHFGSKINSNIARTKLNIATDKKVLLFFGFIRRYKGLDILIEAFNLLSEDYHLIIAGENYEDFTPYQQLIDKNKYKENISIFTDYIADNEVPYFFSAADVCILPYRSATQSGITYISYHFDLPIIATDVGGLKEIVLHKQTGLIVDQANADSLASGIKNYFGKYDVSNFQIHINSLKEKLSWEKFADSIIDFANSI